jgi:hypothetical protein
MHDQQPFSSDLTNGTGTATNGAHPTPEISTREGVTARLRRLSVPLFRFWNGRNGTGTAAADDTLAHDMDGLHAVVRGCEVSFGIDASGVEKRASELASAAASANLPRVEVEYAEVAEEVELAAQCRSVFHAWVERVRTRVQDALQASTQQAAAELKSFEGEIGGLELAVAELPVRRQELREAEAEQAAGQAQLDYPPLISRAHYIILITLLVIVDWIANVPVFSELLPKDPGADGAWRELAARAETMGLLGGAYRIFARAMHHIDASLLALGIIVALVWLAHTFGESLRRFITHSPMEHPTAALTIRGQRRQAGFPALFCFIGVGLLLAVLWSARAGLHQTTLNRVAETDTQIMATQETLRTAESQGDLQAIGEAEKRLESLGTERAQRIERADYARVIGDLNWPILLLNMVLAFTAAVAAYLSTRGRVNGVVVSPRVAALKQRVSALMLEAGARRHAMAQADTAIHRQFGRVEYLLRSRPLSGWRAKAQRLEAVLPSFRAENARLRGIDTANVAAFRSPAQLQLTLDEDEVFLTSAAELDEYRQLHRTLQARAGAALARIDGAIGVPAMEGGDA